MQSLKKILLRLLSVIYLFFSLFTLAGIIYFLLANYLQTCCLENGMGIIFILLLPFVRIFSIVVILIILFIFYVLNFDKKIKSKKLFWVVIGIPILIYSFFYFKPRFLAAYQNMKAESITENAIKNSSYEDCKDLNYKKKRECLIQVAISTEDYKICKNFDPEYDYSITNFSSDQGRERVEKLSESYSCLKEIFEKKDLPGYILR